MKRKENQGKSTALTVGGEPIVGFEATSVDSNQYEKDQEGKLKRNYQDDQQQLS